MKDIWLLTGGQGQAFYFLGGLHSALDVWLNSWELFVQWMGEKRRFSVLTQNLGLQVGLWGSGAWRSLGWGRG